ncbi:helix-turn-helix domain-containing protein [Streptomyces olivaceus]|uniref:helix-turn-helix transcriptional regulator n=1 Tax=Streptomyces olivaceus TaxID=47716 RepID=UPI001CCB1991|nr:helix-turn-helix domain-containing protein [Streptomyces olivaceus]MBZ6252183.1 helix-turn-helix domain-containing protein [Streptomyces olivaceus]
MAHTDEFLTNDELAALVRVRPCTPPVWRHRGIGPKWFKLGDGVSSPVRYRREDVDAWLASKAA